MDPVVEITDLTEKLGYDPVEAVKIAKKERGQAFAMVKVRDETIVELQDQIEKFESRCSLYEEELAFTKAQGFDIAAVLTEILQAE